MHKKEDLIDVCEYKENKFMERISLLVFIAIIIFVLVSLNGCAGTIETMKEPSFNQGCVVVEGGIKLGYFNQEGNAEMCKLKCSENLPECFSYEYHNVRTGCNLSIRNQCGN